MKSTRKALFLVAAALLLGSLGGAVVEASGSGGGGVPMPLMKDKTPYEEANDLFNRGLQIRNKGWKMEEKAEGSSAGAAAKLEAKALKQYEKAAGVFRSAVSNRPNFYQAWSELGYVLRRTGNYKDSLEAYDKSLALNPNYGNAIEYRAEALLGLNQPKEAQQAHARLSILDPGLAEELLEAIDDWVAERQANADGLAPELVNEVGEWVRSRRDLGKTVAAVEAGTARSW